MTINQALAQGIREVRCDPWNPYCRMELPEADAHGRWGVWGHVIDPIGNIVLGNSEDAATGVLLLAGLGKGTVDPDEEGWTPWQKPADYDEKITFAKEQQRQYLSRTATP